MNPPILNREFQHPADGWYQVEAQGEHPHRAAGVVQVIDTASAASIVERFNADAAAGRLRHGHEMLIDHEHFSDQSDQETRAYGWLQELQNRDDGIYGRIRWTATGQAAVDGGDYRFFSTEYEPQDLQVLIDGKPQKVRPLRLAGLTLTNMNNNRGQKPITNRSVGDEVTSRGQGALVGDEVTSRGKGALVGDEVTSRGKGALVGDKVTSRGKGALVGDEVTSRGAGEHFSRHALQYKETCPHLNPDRTFNREAGSVPAAPAATNLAGSPEPADATTTKNRNTQPMKDIAKLLGLSEDAAPEAVSAEIAQLKNRAAGLEAANQTLLTEQMDGLLAEHGIRDEKAGRRLKLVLASLQNRAERASFLADCGFQPNGLAAPTCRAGALAKAEASQGRVLNRGTGAPRETGPEIDDQAMTEKIKNRAQELKGATPARTFDSCWQQAQRENQTQNPKR
jgi:hypothetical protein